MSAYRKIDVILEGQGGELDRATFEVPADCDSQEDYIDNLATDIIEGWILSVGDTIRIVEAAT